MPREALRGVRRGVGEFMRGAFDNGRMDLTQIEGVADLLAADTAAQHRLAVRQTGGALRDTLEECERSPSLPGSRHDVVRVSVPASSRSQRQFRAVLSGSRVCVLWTLFLQPNPRASAWTGSAQRSHKRSI